MSSLSVSILPGIAAAGDAPTQVDADGTLHIHSLTLPPSDLLSPEFKKAYAANGAYFSSLASPPRLVTPARDAPKGEWDKFNASMNHSLDRILAWDREHYPVDVVDAHIAGVHVGIITPKNGIAPENEHRVLINFHGGGFVLFPGLVHAQLESVPIASLGRFKVVMVDYRQAPFYQYPAASEDAEAVYKALLQHYKPEAIGIFGCSAGGMLTAQALAWFQAKGLPRPGAAGIFCSAPPRKQVDMNILGLGDSRIWGLSGFPESNPNRPPALSWYLKNAKADDPGAYPGSSDTTLARYPATLFVSGTRAFDMSLAAVSNAKLLKLGVDSSLYLVEGAWHAAHLFAVDTPEAHDTNAYIAHWFDQHLAR